MFVAQTQKELSPTMSFVRCDHHHTLTWPRGVKIKMSGLFKNVSWYIMRGICTVLLHMQKYIPGPYDQLVACNPRMLRHVSEHLKTQEMCQTIEKIHTCCVISLITLRRRRCVILQWAWIQTR